MSLTWRDGVHLGSEPSLQHRPDGIPAAR